MSLELRHEIIATARAMNARGINQGTSGNLSVRLPGGSAETFSLLITPSAIAYDELVPEDIVELASVGTSTGRRKPSSEWSMHLGILKARPETNVVLHAHSLHATSLACHDRGIPAFHYMVAVAGGSDIRCAPYATFGTDELAENAVRALEGRKACLLSHHGLVVLGDTLRAALDLAVEVETLASQYWRALALGEPQPLNPEEMARIVAKFADYKPKP